MNFAAVGKKKKKKKKIKSKSSTTRTLSFSYKSTDKAKNNSPLLTLNLIYCFGERGQKLPTLPWEDIHALLPGKLQVVAWGTGLRGKFSLANNFTVLTSLTYQIL